MPSFVPTITLNATPPIQATMAGPLTYDEFVFMLGVLNLQVSGIFLEADSGQQLMTNMDYSILDSTGLVTQDTLKPRKDPYQYQNSLWLYPEKGSVLLNGLSSLSFNLQPLQMISLTLAVDQTDPTTLQPGALANNFSANPDTLGNYGRFLQSLKERL